MDVKLKHRDSARMGSGPSVNKGALPTPGVGHQSFRNFAFASAAAALIAASASSAAAAPVGQHDPFERLNRPLYALNNVLDRAFFRPIAMLYRRVLPRPVRRGAHNFLDNLDEPIVFANDVLQLRIRDASRTAVRFAGNTTFGLLGLRDIATGAGLPHHDNNFGFTLGRLGIGPGPYLFIPALGPTTLRGLTGMGVDLYIDPLNQVRHVKSRKLEIAQVVVGMIDGRVEAESDLNDVEATATDPYATVRSVYLQDLAVRSNGGEVTLDSLPDLPTDPSSPASAPETAPTQLNDAPKAF